MPGPTFRAAGARSQSASAATLSPAKPTVDGQKGILLAVVTSKNNATHATGTGGWSLIGQVNSGASFTASLWIAAEAASAPTFTWTGAVACSAQIAYFSDPANSISTTVSASTSNTGSTSTHSTSSINTTKATATVVYVDVSAANTALATPSGWTEDNDTGSATDAGRTVFGEKQIATSGSASGAISVTGAAADWVQWQIEIGGVSVANALEVSKAEMVAWEEPAPGASFSMVEMLAWLDAPSEAAFSKVELVVWLDQVSVTPRRRQAQVIN
ncbi:MAG: hypothetical protein ACO1OX_07805 [Novosphingobium sp.]